MQTSCQVAQSNLLNQLENLISTHLTSPSCAILVKAYDSIFCAHLTEHVRTLAAASGARRRKTACVHSREPPEEEGGVCTVQEEEEEEEEEQEEEQEEELLPLTSAADTLISIGKISIRIISISI